ncbi:hypothetical protein KIN20_038161 [Parelaphostrongylus tenuis]|uniref:Uncharacterized protein n=1 Tax=Parelaphostrongylus tenuis TaxID=148309 RepID=A0AAD5RF91_PARTN|nr:hypothetical protein KIN20_038161 [Parelaphostrongylus tenuis]
MAANGVYQNSIFGLATDFPFKFTNAIIIGNNLCGTFSLKTLQTLHSPILLPRFSQFAFVSYRFSSLRNSHFINTTQNVRWVLKPTERVDSTPHVTTRDYIDTFKQGWPQMINVFLIFFVSLTIFPGIMVDVRDELVGQKYSFVIPA